LLVLVNMTSFNERITKRFRSTIIWIAVTLILSYGTSLLMFVHEYGNNGSLKTVRDLYWWWLNTISGLGASYEPVTGLGRLASTVVIFSGIILLGLVISETSTLIKMIFDRRLEGNIKVGYRNHIVIFGYTSITAGVIKLLRQSFGNQIKIVLISNDTSENPFPREVDFISDTPINKQTMLDANISYAMAAIILANDRFSDPDTYSLVIASAVEETNSKVITIAEMVHLHNRDLFKQIKIDAILDRSELVKDLIAKNRNSKLKRIILKESSLVEEYDPNIAEDLL